MTKISRQHDFYDLQREWNCVCAFSGSLILVKRFMLIYFNRVEFRCLLCLSLFLSSTNYLRLICCVNMKTCATLRVNAFASTRGENETNEIHSVPYCMFILALEGSLVVLCDLLCTAQKRAREQRCWIKIEECFPDILLHYDWSKKQNTQNLFIYNVMHGMSDSE